ncbi:hypothetical protein ACFO5R_13840 [Halosolutus amylolyticus]|uniref:Uncharacterized protein n=1 Tax=Halosolutus amylolyticus TaxID=2932267 RepID=A0ABD5PRS8_9EURY|nr:hypothetical protein [Halosolutus amylolyticus]
MAPNRRDVLELAGAAATMATVGTAPSLAVTAQEATDDLPAYSRWLTIEDGALEFAYVEWAALDDYVRDELEEADPDEEVPAAYEADPMIAPASEGALAVYFVGGLTLGQFRLGRLLDDAFDSTVEGLLRTIDAFVVTGRMNPGEIDAQLTAEPEAEFLVQLERTTEIDGFDVYTPVTDGDDAAIAVDSDALVVVDGEDDPLGILETTIGAAAGDVTRATDDADAFEWAVGTAGDGDVAVGQYGSQSDDELVDFSYEGLEDAESIVSSLTIEDEDTSSGDFAAVVDDPDEAALERSLGATGSDRSIDVDGNQVTATATWREEDLAVDRLRSRL